MKWEYVRHSAELLDAAHDDWMARMGQKGWEMVAIYETFDVTSKTRRYGFFFKRPVGGYTCPVCAATHTAVAALG